MGFEPLEEEDPVFLFRLANLRKKFDFQRLEASNLYRRQGLDYQLYLFDILAIGSDGPTPIQLGALAVQSPLLRLPRSSIVPKHEPGGLMGLVGKLLHRSFGALISQKLSLISYETCPEFDKRYFIFGRDKEAVRKFLSDQVLRRLSRERYWQIETESDLFTFTKIEFNYLKKLKEDVNLEERVREALIIFDLFRER
jgi:hypothetical protein